MTLLTSIIILTILANVVIGGIVLASNPLRNQNRFFFALTANLSAWSALILGVTLTRRVEVAEAMIRAASYTGLLVPIVFHAFCIAIDREGMRAWEIVRKITPHIVLNQAVGLLCFTNLYIVGVHLVDPGQMRTTYGPGYSPVNIYAVVALFSLIVWYARRAKASGGIRRTEIQYTLLGCGLGVVVVLTFNIMMPLLLPHVVSQVISPIASIPMNLTIAYGIATRRLMNVSMLLQRMFAYAILALYLSALYFVVLAVATLLLQPGPDRLLLIPHLLGALAVAFAMAPTHGVLQRLSQKVFINVPATDVRRAARVGSEVFASISTTDEMIDRFEDAVNQAGIDPEFVDVFLKIGEHFKLADSSAGDIVHTAEQVEGACVLVQVLRKTKSPIVADVLKRLRPTDESTRTAAELSNLRARLAAGIFFKGELEGVVLLGSRKSGLIYAGVEQDALQILCNQLGVALENARLYTEVRNNQIYNDTLVDNLLSGLVAVNASSRISVLNREAQRITGLDPDQVLGETVDALPTVLAEALQVTLASGEGMRNLEAVLRDTGVRKDNEEEEIPVSLGTSLFRDAQGRTMGAFLVFTDLTTLKKLEQQVRRSDRLASIGTLSAGMAHEIKNPLVTIKTFTELLPERYKDEDFRDTFSSLVSQEVGRIDRIVNEVLHFARPAKPDLKPASLRELLAGSLRLLTEPMKQKNVRLEADYATMEDTIRADAGLLSQAFVNFLLNALDSMDESGTLTVATAPERPGWQLTGHLGTPSGPHVRLTIQDTGSGIPQDMTDRIFDPFFTTKDHGTGLGLAVAHGIIQDHLGLIECNSQPGQGTAFHIYFPLVVKETPA